MSLGQGQAHESHLGPTSEAISIAAFLAAAAELPADVATTRAQQFSAGLDTTSPPDVPHASTSTNVRAAISTECCVDDLKSSLHHVLADPRLITHVTKSHEAVVHSIYETADPSSRRKRRRTTLPEPAQEHADVSALRQELDAVKLNSWPLTMHSASFIRPPKHSDRNTLTHAKRFKTSSWTQNTHEALLFVSIYNHLSWGHRQLFRSSQHVLSSSQTLGDLFEVIPCHSNEIPKEIQDDSGERIGYEMPTARTVREACSGCVICIEGVAYGDGQNMVDYAEKLLKLRNTPNDKAGQLGLEKGVSMHDTTLASLTVHLHKPYWLLHAGSCEHFIVIDQIRLWHPTDPPLIDYPLTTHITPPLLDLCRACNKVPAVYAVLGDMRLGESPFVICGPCWRWMGIPDDSSADEVMIVPLLKHEHGWGGTGG